MSDNRTMEELIRINEQLRAELKEAQAANTAKETFLSNMSHDIRTPMNAIVGMTALAKNHIDEKARVADALDKIEVASSHLLSLINDILDMSRINSGRMKLEENLFSLSDLLHEVLIIVQPAAAQKNHHFSFNAEKIFAESLYGDALRLKQIFVNIISNAVKYTEDAGEIRVDFFEEPSGDLCDLVFICRDNGIGMEKEFLDRIFDPFERVSSSTISRIEGTGLGMSIVKRLLDAMHGTILVESEPGRGTTVTIHLPLKYKQEATRSEALEGRRILLLEADDAMRDRYKDLLSFADCAYALSSTEAVAALTEADYEGRPFDLLIFGRSIGPDGDLIELADYIHRSFAHLVMVLISDIAWEQIEYRAERAGISKFLPLPIFRKSLINGLVSALSDSSADTASMPGVPDLAGRHILLVEDNLINTEIAKEILGMTNASVDTAENGQIALDLFLASPENYYDLILMDIQMPVMDGYTATRSIRASDRADAAGVLILAMTANTFAEDIAKARASGMNGHLAKPIDINAFMQALGRIGS